MTSRYTLIEPTPYPRAERIGGLTDPAGRPLHGTYERQVPEGFRAAIINNGRVLHRYTYPASQQNMTRSTTRSFANLVHTLAPWQVPLDAARPVTEYPASEHPHAAWRSLWNSPIILDSVIRGTKLAGMIHGRTTDIETWESHAAAHGLVVRRHRDWTDVFGDAHAGTLIARPGPLASTTDLLELDEDYLRQLPMLPVDSALDRLSTLHGEHLDPDQLVNPNTASDLIVTGYCFGYPTPTTAACIVGTHG